MQNKIVVCELYRFGYNLTVLAKTRTEGKKLLMAEYNRAYLDRNGFKPTKEERKNARECIEYREYKVGVVEWC